MTLTRLTRRDAVPLATVLAVAVALGAPRLDGPVDLRYDASVYYTVGASLAHGDGYRIISEPGAIPEVQYPPGQSLVVAGAIGLTGSDDPAVAGHALRVLFRPVADLCLRGVPARPAIPCALVERGGRPVDRVARTRGFQYRSVSGGIAVCRRDGRVS